MSRRLVAMATMAMLILAACSTGPAPRIRVESDRPLPPPRRGRSIAASATVMASATPAPSTGAPSATPAASVSAAAVACSETTKAGTVAVRIEDFSFTPDAIRVRVGQVIRFTNAGFEPHTATLDGGCRTQDARDQSAHDGLIFEAAGSVAFHCSIHT